MRWLGQVLRMDDDRMPKELLHEELSQETHPTGGPHDGLQERPQSPADQYTD